MNTKVLSIITPTYNRVKYLPRLYLSLIRQTQKNFIWIIIDDGSTDDTENLVCSFSQELEVVYKKKLNGGKPSALNVAFNLLETELVMIVDSDDYLADDAVEIIVSTWEKYRNTDNEFCGLCYLKANTKGIVIGDHFPREGIANLIDMRIRKHVRGDKAEVFISQCLKDKRFPIFDEEKFIGEDYIWNDLGKAFDTIYINKIIYYCEYLEGGLSRSGRKLRIHSPKGGMTNSLIMISKEFPLWFQLKKGILYNCYYYFNGRETVGNLNRYQKKILLLTRALGYCLYRYWKKYE